MAKGIGLIGSFNGKVGNMVGYSLKDSNNKQTQGVRVHQPVVKNPKTYAQALQRAKYIPIMELGKRLKLYIQRGNQYLPYGVKSKNAWLKQVMTSYAGPWLTRDQKKLLPPQVQISFGSLPDIFPVLKIWNFMNLHFGGHAAAIPTNMGEYSAALLQFNSKLKIDDQITVIACYEMGSSYAVFDYSFIVDPNSTEAIPGFIEMTIDNSQYRFSTNRFLAGAVIISRDGGNGTHLRSKTYLRPGKNYSDSYFTDAAKQAAAESYMSGSVNTDWEEEEIQE